MLRLPTLPYGKPQINPVTQDKYVCPPWVHPLNCMVDSGSYIPESLTQNPERVVEEVKKNFSWWPYLVAGALFTWAYLREHSEMRLPIKRNPHAPSKKCSGCGEPLDFKKVEWLKTPSDALGGDTHMYFNCPKCASTGIVKRELLTGGLADYVPDSAFEKKDLEKGIKVEMEHTSDRALAKEIAKDHLLEDPDYYEKLEKMEAKKNPVIEKKKRPDFDSVISENIFIGKLPSNHKAFITWEENTYQANLFETPDKVTPDNQSVFMPRNATKGRILPWGMRTPFELFFKNAPKSLLAAAQYIVHPDKIEIIFMSTRAGWKRQGLMSAIIKAIKKEHGINSITYWEPTKVGEKFQPKQNPAQKCYYNAHFEFKRGGKKSKHDYLLQAWDMSEAQQIARGFVNRSLKNATLESLSVQKVSC